MKKIRICTIGAGFFAGFMHGPVLRALAQRDPALELAAVCDLDAERAKTFAAATGYRNWYTDFREMLDSERPDGVVLLTPVTATAAVGSAVLAAGYPAMLEKPPGRNRAEITALIRASQQGNAPAMVAFNRRCSPLLTRGMELLKQEAPKEKLEHIRCDFYRSERFDADFSTTAVHGIDAVRHLSGSRYARVDFHYQELERDAGQICNFFLTGTMTDGCSVQLSFCPSTGAALERFTLNTRSLTVSVESVPPGGGCDFPGRIFVYRGGKLLRIEAPPAHEFDREEFYLAGYYQENCRFIERLREGFPPENDLELSLEAVEIADACRRRVPLWTAETVRS